MASVIQIRKDLAAYSSPQAVIIPDEIDEREMSAGFVICSASVDREEEVVVPQGCRDTLDQYRANPIVLWDHNHDATCPPIGLSEDKSKRFTLRIFDDDRITARCFFHGQPFGGTNLSLDIFNLVVKGALRGASVGMIPLEPKINGRIYRRWNLTEWSITPLQSNQDCLRMCLSRGYVTTKSLVRSLSASLPPAPVWANGFSHGEVMEVTTGRIRFEKSLFRRPEDVTKWLAANGHGVVPLIDKGAAWIAGYVDDSIKTETTKKLASGVKAMLVKSYDDDEDDEEEKKPKKDKDEADGDDKPAKGEDDEKPEKSEESDEGDGDTEEGDDAPEETQDHSQKQGAKDLATLHEHFDHFFAGLEEMKSRCDNPGVAKAIAKAEAKAQDIVSIIEEAVGKEYPGLDINSIKPGTTDANATTEDVGEPVENDQGQEVGSTPAPEETDEGADDPFEDDEDVLKRLSLLVGDMDVKSKKLRITG